MDVTPQDPTPVLVIRVWFEDPGGAAGFRARVVRDEPGGGSRTDGMASADDVVAAVSSWLETWVRAAPHG